MKIGRRTFLSIGSFIVGGAVGTALSPLPTKLTDDLSIWTQMWPWTPVPEDGEINYVNSVCTLCPGGCGISVRKIDDRAVKIEGMNGHPVNKGGICMLGLSGLQLLYGPTRVTSPLKRVGERGEGKWKAISWKAAVAEVAERLKSLRANGESHTVACISGNDQGTVPQLLKRFLTAYGSPNFMTIPSVQDSYEITLKLMQGADASPGFDAENAGFILSFGSGIIDGWGSPVHMFKANSTWKEKKATVVQIEPRLSNTAAKADQWIPAKPGTEAALALGLAHVIIKAGLYHKNFVENYANGFDAFQKLTQAYPPEKVAAITDIDADTIVSLAKAFAKATNPLAICGRGKGNTPVSLYESMAVHALNALVGNINQKGGVWAVPKPDYIQWAEVATDEIAQKGLAQPRMDGACTDQFPCAQSLVNRFIQGVSSDKASVQALFVTNANPCYALPDTRTVKAALDKIPFVVSFSSYMDETAQQADLILPNHIYLERYEDVPTPMGIQKPVISMAKPVVSPMYNTKHTGDVVMLLAKALGDSIAQAFPWKSYEACLQETFGDDWKTLSRKGYVAKADTAPPSWETAFTTASQKFEFLPAAVRAAEIEGEEGTYPLVLMPYDSIRLASGYIGAPPFTIKTVSDKILKGKDIFAEVNPETAKGMKEGDYAVIITPRGQAQVRIHLSEGIRPGVIAMPAGLGHTAYDKYLAEKGVNVNDLMGCADDPASGLNAAWGIRAKLTRA